MKSLFNIVLLAALLLAGAQLPLRAQLVVTNANDNGAGSLRQIIADSTSGGTITFTGTLSGATILLTSGQLVLDRNLTIDASALPGGIQINGHANGRIFQVSSGINALLDSLTITNGMASYGGGIWNNGTLTVNRCTLAGNTVTLYGAGIENGGTLTANQCTLTANRCDNNGGAGIDNNGGTLTVNQCTVTGNTATHPSGYGGVYAFAGATMVSNSIVTGNTAANPINNNLGGTITTSGVNLTNGAPLLAPLGNYGGPTPTMPPLAGSPAIDADDDAVTNSFATDQRGLARLSGAHVDIGAVEAQWAPSENPPLLTGPLWTAFNGTFQFAFTNVTNADFSVLATTNLPSGWTLLGPAIQIAPGQYAFTDPDATNHPQRFYRVESP